MEAWGRGGRGGAAAEGWWLIPPPLWALHVICNTPCASPSIFAVDDGAVLTCIIRTHENPRQQVSLTVRGRDQGGQPPLGYRFHVRLVDGGVHRQWGHKPPFGEC